MNAVSTHLFEKLTGKRLLSEVHEVLETGKQGFDVRVRSESELLLRSFEDVLVRVMGEECLLVHVVHSLEGLSKIRQEEMRQRRFQPIVYLEAQVSSVGAGLVDHPLPPLVDLLPATHHAVRLILEHHGLVIFHESFGPERITALKPLLASGNLSGFIDAVIQTAYLEGARGETAKAEAFLRNLRHEDVPDQEGALDNAMLHRVLQWILERDGSPLQFSKALLSYYVVKVKEQSTMQASQVLQISRTTLQTHLQLAERVGVPEIFGRRPSRRGSLAASAQGAG